MSDTKTFRVMLSNNRGYSVVGGTHFETEMGSLKIYADGDTVAVFANGAWDSIERT